MDKRASSPKKKPQKPQHIEKTNVYHRKLLGISEEPIKPTPSLLRDRAQWHLLNALITIAQDKYDEQNFENNPERGV